MRIGRFTITNHHRERDRVVIAEPKRLEGIWAIGSLTGQNQMKKAFRIFNNYRALKKGLNEDCQIRT